jgi:hypothetical protein
MSKAVTTTVQNAIILYNSEDGETHIQLRTMDGTVWLSQLEIAELFQTTKQNVSLHAKNILEEGELSEAATVKDSLTVQIEGGRSVSRAITHYNLDLILAIGYRVRSPRGTQFRQWATANLREFMIKGFVIDDERLMNPPGPGVPDYFDELLARIRAIRASERRFYQKVLDIYATSIDYTADSAIAQQFFATVQNKMHFAAHGHTAAEVIYERADAAEPLMGLTSTKTKGVVRKEDVSVAKNYLNEDELGLLNRIVTLYLDYAELQAISKQPMRMVDWLTKLDEFLRLSGRELLDNAGVVSHDTALKKAEEEYEVFKKAQDLLPRSVDAYFERTAKRLEQIGKAEAKTTPAKKRKN